MMGNLSLTLPARERGSTLWIWRLVGRVVAHAVLGGLATALAGALLVAAVGALTGYLIYPAVREPDSALLGAYVGAVFGGAGGGMTGVVLLSIGAFFGEPECRPWPPRRLLVPVLQGMGMATLGVTASYLAVTGATCLFEGTMSWGAFANQIGEYLVVIMFGVPATMMCGAIAGAVVGFRRVGRRVQRTEL